VGQVEQHLTVRLRRGEAVTVDKVVTLFTSRDAATGGHAVASRTRARRAPRFDALRERHILAWQLLWKRARLDVGGGPPQRTINLRMFHVLQTLSPHTIGVDAGVPARGLHGEAYRGHVFWDELFVLPFLSMRFPEIVRALLLYRWRRLPAARRAAYEAGHVGAMYPWQSGSDGREETQLLHLFEMPVQLVTVFAQRVERDVAGARNVRRGEFGRSAHIQQERGIRPVEAVPELGGVKDGVIHEDKCSCSRFGPVSVHGGDG
jgi:trehalose/maltose hydrolase-like predicted phosphorylase